MQNRPDNQVNAGFFVRLAAYLVDCLIVGAVLLAIRVPIWVSQLASPDNPIVRDFIFSYSIADIVIYGLTATYFIIFTYKTGSTIGKKMFHLRVISSEDRDLTLCEVVFRETVGRFLSALIVNVGYIIIGFTKEKQGLHDMLSDTEVIYYHEKEVEAGTPVYTQKVAGLSGYVPASYTVPSYMTSNYMAPKPEVSEDEVSDSEFSNGEALDYVTSSPDSPSDTTNYSESEKEEILEESLEE